MFCILSLGIKVQLAFNTTLTAQGGYILTWQVSQVPFSPHLPQHKLSNSTVKEGKSVKHATKTTPAHGDTSSMQVRNKKTTGFFSKRGMYL